MHCSTSSKLQNLTLHKSFIVTMLLSRCQVRTDTDIRPDPDFVQKSTTISSSTTIAYSVFSWAASFIRLHLRELDVAGISLYSELFHGVSFTVGHTQCVVLTGQCKQILFTPTSALYLLCVFPQHWDFPTYKYMHIQYSICQSIDMHSFSYWINNFFQTFS